MASTDVERPLPSSRAHRLPSSRVRATAARRAVLLGAAFWLALALATQLAGLAAAGDLLPGEATVASAVHGFDWRPLDYVMQLFSIIGGGSGLVVLLAGLVTFLLLRRRYAAAAFVAAGVLGAGAITRVLKDVTARPRPELTNAYDRSFLTVSMREVVLVVAVAVVIALLTRWRARALAYAAVFGVLLGATVLLDAVASAPDRLDSFPSGHATGAAALAAVVVALAWGTPHRYGVLAGAALFACLVALSRMHFGVHYPSDALGGFAVALAWVCFLLLLAPLARSWEGGFRKRQSDA